MSKKLFTDQEQKLLKKHTYVKAVSEKGKCSREIFEDAGFDIDLVGIHRAKSALKRRRAAYKEKGVSGLEDTRKYHSGRPLERE